MREYHRRHNTTSVSNITMNLISRMDSTVGIFIGTMKLCIITVVIKGNTSIIDITGIEITKMTSIIKTAIATIAITVTLQTIVISQAE